MTVHHSAHIRLARTNYFVPPMKASWVCSQGIEDTPDVKAPSVSVMQCQATPHLSVCLLL